MANKKDFILLGLVAAAIAVTDIAVLLGILILRPVSGIFLFKLNKLEITERSVLTIGLSIAFLMFYGLLLNQADLFFGHSFPLYASNGREIWN